MEPSTGLFNKRPDLYPSQGDLYKCFFARPSRLPTPDHVLLVPQCIGNPQLMRSENIHFAINSGPQHHTPPEKAIGLPVSSFRAISPFRPGRRVQPLILAPEGHRVKLEPSSYRSSAGKIASNDKHKQSEKHRRDEMGAYVQAADIIRGSLQPAIIFQCHVCIQDMSLNENLSSSPTTPDKVTTLAMGAASKKTKNQSIEEGLMSQFSMLLHKKREDVGLRLDEIRALAHQMWRKKQIGKSNGTEVLVELLYKMRYLCESHDIPPCACGKHEVEDWHIDGPGPLIMPPSSSSRNSPMVGRKRSRETTKEEEDIEEGRRLRRRSMARL